MVKTKNFEKLVIPNSMLSHLSQYPKGDTITKALIAWVSQVDSMTDNVNDLNKFLRDYLDDLELGLSEETQKILDKWVADGTLAEKFAGAFRFKPVGKDALEIDGSIYIGNDHNLFGRTADGKYYNLITPQNNGVLDIGDMDVPIMWLQTKGYHSLRAPLTPSYQEVDENGVPVAPGRTMLHQGNSSGHLVVFSVGEHELIQGMDNELHTLTEVNGVFPEGAYNNFYYKIPRAGMYHFSPTVSLKNAPTAPGYLRFSVRIMRASGGTTTSVMQDVYYDPSKYGTPFLTASFMYRLSKDDQVQVVARPLNENLMIGNGTKLYIYQHGDTIQS